MDYRKCAEEIVSHIGGRENIVQAAHCATRLRLVIKDNGKVDKKALENVDGVNLRGLLEELNKRIETLYDRDHLIGHAYFIKCEKLDDIAEVFCNKIIPLLQEYFFDDYEQIQKVLGDKIIKRKPLGGDKFRYTVDVDALKDAESYKL
ncbi:MAG: PTS transporter subunit EIIB [Selenomonadaceae bacterium]|nr:PTS transporter subunit EIIB [Selenomonadaceae bacterium]